MTKENKKRLATIIIMIIGVVFLIWGGRIYNAYPGIKEAKHMMWSATKTAGVQYIIGIVCLYGGYFYYDFIKKK